MVRFFLNSCFLVFISFGLKAQTFPKIMLDTQVIADEVYLDPLHQIYLVNNLEKSISKFSIQFKLLKKISFSQGWDQAILDVSDPFKCILYYPGDYRIHVLDESLSVISSYEESELNSESNVCHFSSDIIGIFSNNVLKLINYSQQKTINSDLLRIDRRQDSKYPNKLKKSNEYLYLLQTGVGIYRFTNQLFEDRRWLNPKISLMDVSGDKVMYYDEENLIQFDTKTMLEEILVADLNGLKSFAVNSDFMILLMENRLVVMHR